MDVSIPVMKRTCGGFVNPPGTCDPKAPCGSIRCEAIHASEAREWGKGTIYESPPSAGQLVPDKQKGTQTG
jgi:hypothetical protein